MASRLLSRASRLAPAGPSRIFVRAESTAAAAAPTFEPALRRGQEPAYDLALEYIEQDKAAQLKRLEAAKAKAGPNPTPAQAERIRQLEVNAWINDPATRRLFASTNGTGSMDRAVMRELAQRAWKREGGLDLLMQRLYQLGVVPDMLPDVLPTADMTVMAENEPIEAGKIVPSSSFANPPRVHVQLFNHPSTPSEVHPTPEAKFTLLVVDPDSPSHETHSFTQRVHYAKADIVLSVLSGATDLIASPGTELLAYEPPAPPKGSGKHRYVFLLVRQGDVHHPVTRDNFELRAYLAEHNLSEKDVVAASLIRSQWTEAEAEHINATYEKFRGEPAPVYGLPPKELRYGYPLNAKQQRAQDARQEAYESVINEMQNIGQGEPEKQAA